MTPTFVVSRNDGEIAYRLAQLAEDHAECLTSRCDGRQFALRQYVLESRMTPDQADELTKPPGYSFGMRCAAIMEAQWLYGYRDYPWD